MLDKISPYLILADTRVPRHPSRPTSRLRGDRLPGTLINANLQTVHNCLFIPKWLGNSELIFLPQTKGADFYDFESFGFSHNFVPFLTDVRVAVIYHIVQRMRDSSPQRATTPPMTLRNNPIGYTSQRRWYLITQLFVYCNIWCFDNAD